MKNNLKNSKNIKTTEGTPSVKKHEQIGIVTLAYIIGFTTAFIAFGISSEMNSQQNTESGETYNRVVHSNDSTDKSEQTGAVIKAVLKNDGLYVLNGKEERIISAYSEEDPPLVPGFHSEVFATSVSPDGNFVHFCVQLDRDEDQCRNLVYSVADDITFSVNVDGEPVYSSRAESPAIVWNPDNSLIIEEMVSIDGTAPWKLTNVDEAPVSL